MRKHSHGYLEVHKNRFVSGGHMHRIERPLKASNPSVLSAFKADDPISQAWAEQYRAAKPGSQNAARALAELERLSGKAAGVLIEITSEEVAENAARMMRGESLLLPKRTPEPAPPNREPLHKVTEEDSGGKLREAFPEAITPEPQEPPSFETASAVYRSVWGLEPVWDKARREAFRGSMAQVLGRKPNAFRWPVRTRRR